MRPGYGYGGPCYPRDNQALALYAKQVDASDDVSRGLTFVRGRGESMHSRGYTQLQRVGHHFTFVRLSLRQVPSRHHGGRMLARGKRRVISQFFPCPCLTTCWSRYVFEDVTYKPRCAVAMIDESPKLRVVAQSSPPYHRSLIDHESSGICAGESGKTRHHPRPASGACLAETCRV